MHQGSNLLKDQADVSLQDRIVAAVATGGEMTRSEIMAAAGEFTIPAFYAATSALVAAGRLRRVGRTKGSRYAIPGMRWEMTPVGRWVREELCTPSPT
jgi:hypothetical protein